MSKYELVYFNAQGRGESIRLALAAAGVQYTDTRVKYDEWTKVQPSTPQGRLPYLTVGGKKVSQSLAILRYIGREHGMAGENNMESFYIDEIMDTCADLLHDWEQSLMNGPNDEASQKKFKTESVTKYFKMLEDLVKDHGNVGFAVGKKLTIADVMLYNSIQLGGLETLGKYPCLQANRKKVEADPKIAQYLKTRPKEIF